MNPQPSNLKHDELDHRTTVSCQKKDNFSGSLSLDWFSFHLSRDQASKLLRWQDKFKTRFKTCGTEKKFTNKEVGLALGGVDSRPEHTQSFG